MNNEIKNTVLCQAKQYMYWITNSTYDNNLYLYTKQSIYILIASINLELSKQWLLS